MTMTKYGTPDICPKCRGAMEVVAASGQGTGLQVEKRKCKQCGYEADTVFAIETGETPPTREEDSA